MHGLVLSKGKSRKGIFQESHRQKHSRQEYSRQKTNQLVDLFSNLKQNSNRINIVRSDNLTINRSLLGKDDIGMAWFKMGCHACHDAGAILVITLNQASLIAADKLPELFNRLTIKDIFELLHFSIASGKGLQRKDCFRQDCSKHRLST